jgi:hypothetical protein
MNQCELDRFLSQEHNTWESIKLTLLSKDNAFPILKSFSDDSIILDSVIYLNTSKGSSVSLQNNEFVVLLTSTISDFNATTSALSYDLTNNQANLIGAQPGTIFTKSLIPAVGGFSSFTFLLFRIN